MKSFPQRVNSTENSSWNWTLTPLFYPLWVCQTYGLVPDRGLYHLADQLSHCQSYFCECWSGLWEVLVLTLRIFFSHKLSWGEGRRSRQDAVSGFRWCHGLIMCTAGGFTYLGLPDLLLLWFCFFPLCLFVSWFMSITGAKSSQGVQLPGWNQTGAQQEKNRPRRRRSTNNGWETSEGQPDVDVKAVLFLCTTESIAIPTVLILTIYKLQQWLYLDVIQKVNDGNELSTHIRKQVWKSLALSLNIIVPDN